MIQEDSDLLSENNTSNINLVKSSGKSNLRDQYFHNVEKIKGQTIVSENFDTKKNYSYVQSNRLFSPENEFNIRNYVGKFNPKFKNKFSPNSINHKKNSENLKLNFNYFKKENDFNKDILSEETKNKEESKHDNNIKSKKLTRKTNCKQEDLKYLDCNHSSPSDEFISIVKTYFKSEKYKKDTISQKVLNEKRIENINKRERSIIMEINELDKKLISKVNYLVNSRSSSNFPFNYKMRSKVSKCSNNICSQSSLSENDKNYQKFSHLNDQNECGISSKCINSQRAPNSNVQNHKLPKKEMSKKSALNLSNQKKSKGKVYCLHDLKNFDNLKITPNSNSNDNYSFCDKKNKIISYNDSANFYLNSCNYFEENVSSRFEKMQSQIE